MPKITVKAKIGGTIHPRLGELVKGQEYEIEEVEFGEEIFERQPADEGVGAGLAPAQKRATARVAPTKEKEG